MGDCSQYIANYEAALARERLYLEVIDDLLTSIASNNRMIISASYNRVSEKIAAAKQIGLIHR
jgi:uncharacterized HAD superfamily protein